MGNLLVHVVPRARKSEVAGRFGEAIRIRIAAPPTDGAANAELVRFLASALGVPGGAIALTHGATARRKRLAVTGISSAEMERKLLASAKRAAP
jgi:uncharacterized protein (TIGR00251 family)